VLTTILLIVYAVLHGVSFVLHAISKATRSQLADKLATMADTAAADVEEVEEVVAPSGAAAAVKAVAPFLALWLIGAALLTGAIALSACNASDLPKTPFGEVGIVYHCWWFDGVTRTEDDECLTRDRAITRVDDWQESCESAHADPRWFCDAECKWSGFPDLCALPSDGGDA
jgi:hypothetical protein